MGRIKDLMWELLLLVSDWILMNALAFLGNPLKSRIS
jgi:hypothetical protein